MKLTNKEREIIMSEKYYIHLEEIKPNHFVYGVMGVLDDTPFDYEISKMDGANRNDALNKITKKVIKENKINLDKNVFTFKYDELRDAKSMEHEIRYDDFYRDYRVTSLPAVFLSDMNNVQVLKNMVQKNALQEKIIEQSKYNLIR